MLWLFLAWFKALVMGTSDIAITALVATPSIRGNKLAATVSATGPAANIPNLMVATVEFWASTTNDFTTATKVVEGNVEALHAGLIEEQTYYYWAKAKNNSGNYGAVYPVSPTGGVSCTAIGMAGLAFGLANGKMVASVASSALTVAIKTLAGNDPSEDDLVYLAFNNPSLTAGTYQIRRITSALALTISSGSTLDTVDGVPFCLWAVIVDDAGTLRLGLTNRYSATTGILYTLPEVGKITTEAEGGAGGADLWSIYTAIAVPVKAHYRRIGSLTWESGLATAGSWTDEPTSIDPQILGSIGPGDVLQDEIFLDNTADNGAITTPYDDTVPQNNEGVLLPLSIGVSPTSAANILDIEYETNCTYSVEAVLTLSVFQIGSADALVSSWGDVRAADAPIVLRAFIRRKALSVATLVFQFRVGGSTAGTVYINSTSAGGKYGGTLFTRARVVERMG